MQYAIQTGQWRTPAGHEMTVHYRSDTNDWNTVSATLTHDEYHLPRRMTGRAVDVGGYLGTVGIALALDNPEMTVTIIEPVPFNAQLIRQNIDAADLWDRVALIEGAVSGDHEPVTVSFGYRGSESLEHHAFVGNSTLAYDGPGAADHDEVTYTPVTLADLLADGDIDWLKIDTEGAEWAFLTGPVKRVREIVGEWHPVRGHTLADMAKLLGKTHDVTFDGPEAGPGGFRAVRK